MVTATTPNAIDRVSVAGLFRILPQSMNLANILLAILRRERGRLLEYAELFYEITEFDRNGLMRTDGGPEDMGNILRVTLWKLRRAGHNVHTHRYRGLVYIDGPEGFMPDSSRGKRKRAARLKPDLRFTGCASARRNRCQLMIQQATQQSLKHANIVR
jgi:hypothetical protein